MQAGAAYLFTQLCKMLILATFFPATEFPAGTFDVVGVSHDSVQYHIDGLVQERFNSSALAMELCLSCTNPLIQCTNVYGMPQDLQVLVLNSRVSRHFLIQYLPS